VGARAGRLVTSGACVYAAGVMVNDTLVWLFDVDGTLLLTEGAGRKAIAAALQERYGVEDDLAHIAMAGRTDPLIVADALRAHGLEPDGEGERDALWQAIFAHMRRLMTPPRGGLLPGVSDCLDRVGDDPAWVPALLTGNVREMARIKLAAFGLYDRFAFGAFGDEAPDRNALAVIAVERAADLHGVPPSRCVVVGDTEHDIACARAAGAHVVAVATGGRPRALLAAHEPDLLLDDLREADRLMDWARTLSD
jgi:phosphoglycolate phosphatase